MTRCTASKRRMAPCTVEIALYLLAWEKAYAHLHYTNVPLVSSTSDAAAKRHPVRVTVPMGKPCLISAGDYKLSAKTLEAEWAAACRATDTQQRTLSLPGFEIQEATETIDMEIGVLYASVKDFLTTGQHLLISTFETVFPYPSIYSLSTATFTMGYIAYSSISVYFSKTILTALHTGDHQNTEKPTEQAVLQAHSDVRGLSSLDTSVIASVAMKPTECKEQLAPLNALLACGDPADKADTSTGMDHISSLSDQHAPAFLFLFTGTPAEKQDAHTGMLSYRRDRLFISIISNATVYNEHSNITWICHSLEIDLCNTMLQHYLDDNHHIVQLFLQKIALKPIIYLYPCDSDEDCCSTDDLVRYFAHSGPFAATILVPFRYTQAFLSSAESAMNVSADIFTHCFLLWVTDYILGCRSTPEPLISSLTDFAIMGLFYHYRMLTLSLLGDSGLCTRSYYNHDPYVLEDIAIETLFKDIHVLQQTTFYASDKRLDFQIYTHLMTLHKLSSVNIFSLLVPSSYISGMVKLFAFSTLLELPSSSHELNWTQDSNIQEVECAFFGAILTRYIEANGCIALRNRCSNGNCCGDASGLLPDTLFTCNPGNSTYLKYYAKHAAPVLSFFSPQLQTGTSQLSTLSAVTSLLLLSSRIILKTGSSTDTARALIVASRDIISRIAATLSPPMIYTLCYFKGNMVKIGEFNKRFTLTSPTIHASFYTSLYNVPQYNVQSELQSLSKSLTILNTLQPDQYCTFCSHYADQPITFQMLTPKASIKSDCKILNISKSVVKTATTANTGTTTEIPAGIVCIATATRRQLQSLVSIVELTKIISSAHNQAHLLEQLYVKSHSDQEDSRRISIVAPFCSSLAVPCYTWKTLGIKTFQCEKPLLLIYEKLNCLKESLNGILTGSDGQLSLDTELINTRYIHIMHADSFKNLLKVFFSRSLVDVHMSTGTVTPYPRTDSFTPMCMGNSMLSIVEPLLIFVCSYDSTPSATLLIEALNTSAKSAHLHFLQKAIETSRVSTATINFVDTVVALVKTQGIFSHFSIYFLILSRLVFCLRSIILNESPTVVPQLRCAAAAYLYLLGDRGWLVDYLANLLRIIKHYTEMSSATIALEILTSLLCVFCRIDAGLYMILKLCISSICRGVCNTAFCAQVLRSAAIFPYKRQEATDQTMSFDFQRANTPTCMCNINANEISSACLKQSKTACSLKTILGIQRNITTLIGLLTDTSSAYSLQIITSLDDISKLVQSVLFYAVTRVRLFSEVSWLEQLPAICNSIYYYIGRCTGKADSPCTRLSIETCSEPVQNQIHIIHLQMLGCLISLLISNYDLVTVAASDACNPEPYWQAIYQVMQHLICFDTPQIEFTVSSLLHLLVRFATSTHPHISAECRKAAFNLIFILLSHTNIMTSASPANPLYIQIITGTFATSRVIRPKGLTFLQWIVEIQPYIAYFPSNYGNYCFTPHRSSIPRIFTYMEPACPNCFFGSCSCSSLATQMYYNSISSMENQSFLKKALAIGQSIIAISSQPNFVCSDMRTYGNYEQVFVQRMEALRTPRIKKDMDFIAKLMSVPSTTGAAPKQILVLSDLCKEEVQLLQRYHVYAPSTEMRTIVQNVLTLLNTILGDTAAKYDILSMGQLIIRDGLYGDKLPSNPESIVVHFKNRCLCIRSISG